MFLIGRVRRSPASCDKVKPRRSRTPVRLRLVHLNAHFIYASTGIIRQDVGTNEVEGRLLSQLERAGNGSQLGNSWGADRSELAEQLSGRASIALEIAAGSTQQMKSPREPTGQLLPANVGNRRHAAPTTCLPGQLRDGGTASAAIECSPFIFIGFYFSLSCVRLTLGFQRWISNRFERFV